MHLWCQQAGVFNKGKWSTTAVFNVLFIYCGRTVITTERQDCVTQRQTAVKLDDRQNELR